ncbi:MAG TPA: type II CAAX endopeptidase family protein [Terriglobales bacterium]|nr:type II CAAX endopeptidase family protein [Terriglobales bacterium]
MSANSGWNVPEPETTASPPPATPPESANVPPENPPFGGVEVLQIGILMFVVPIVLAPFLVVALHKFFYPQLTFGEVALKPWVLLTPQFVWFAIIALFLIDYTKAKFHQTLWQAVRWNWPKQTWPVLVGIGFVTLLALQGLERLLPLPQKSPFDQFFDKPLDAYAFAFLAIAFAPFMEELFFRGFLYPVLARRLGVMLGIVITAMIFAFIHVFEYKAWGPVLIIFIVGVVLTAVRAKMKSVGASFIVHSIYNGIPIIATLVVSRGFHDLHKLAR